MYTSFIETLEFIIYFKKGISIIPKIAIEIPMYLYAFLYNNIKDFNFSIFLSAIGLYILNTNASPTPNSAKDKIVYNYQIEYTYIPKSQNILPRQRVLKFNNGKLERKIFVNGNIDLINFLNNEIKIYN